MIEPKVRKALKSKLNSMERETTPLDVVISLYENLGDISTRMKDFTNEYHSFQQETTEFRDGLQESIVDAYIKLSLIVLKFGYSSTFSEKVEKRLTEKEEEIDDTEFESYEF